MTNKYLEKIAGLPPFTSVMKGVESVVSTANKGVKAVSKGMDNISLAMGKNVTGPARRLNRLNAAASMAGDRANFAKNKVGDITSANRYLNKAITHKNNAASIARPRLESALKEQSQARRSVLKGAAGIGAVGTVAHYAKKGWNANDNDGYYVQ